MAEKNKLPEIRIKGFEGEWEVQKIGDIFKVTRGNVLAATQTIEKQTESAPYPVYSSQTKNDGLMGYYNQYLFEDAITWTTDGANAGTVNYREGKFYSTNVNGVLLSDNGYANKAVAESLNKIAWRHVSKVGNPKLMNNVMSEIPLSLPANTNELIAISKHFQNLDRLISLHQRKYDKLLTVKKSMLEKMFPKKGADVPEIRFKGFEGKWEEKKLGEVVQIKDSARIPNELWAESGVRYLRSSDLENRGQDGKLFISIDAYEDYKSKTGAPEYGDVLFNSGGNIGLSLLMTDNKPLYVQGGAILYARTSQSKDIDGGYLNVYFSTPRMVKYIDISSAGGTIKHFTLKPANVAPFIFPKITEQREVSEFFQNLDTLITQHKNELEKLKSLKKACLEKMFV